MITSTNHEIIKHLKKLNQKKYRNEYNQYLVEGNHLVEEAYKMNVIDAIFSTTEKTDYDNVKYYQLSESVMNSISNVKTPQGIIAICNKRESIEIGNRVLLLDSLQDPGNLGTLMRSAVAFGFSTIIAEDSVDFYNEKVIRSSQGAIFKINIINGKISETIAKYKNKYHIYGTSVKNGKKLSHIDLENDHVMLILGNEGNGVRDDINNLTHENIYIEMANTESLNVSIAGSIIMYEISKGCAK